MKTSSVYDLQLEITPSLNIAYLKIAGIKYDTNMFKMKKEDETGRHMICPYCKNMFQERKTLTAHLFRDTCYEYEKIRESKTGEETWKDIVEANEKKTEE